ncbi:MAG TPA: sodium:solute symporter family protein [Longimicrobiales bacterium]|nr:sodium:solute symporter family protein [Longimicrobiales bacterium]
MEQWVVVSIVIALYLAVTLTIGLVSGRRASKSVQGYVAGDRSFNLLVMYFVTGAMVFSAFAFLGGPGFAYGRGAAAFYILAYGALGMAPFYWLGPRAAKVGRRHGYVTQAQLVTGRFPSKWLSVGLAVMSVAAFVPYITLQMRGAGIVIEVVTEGHVPLWLGAALSYGIVVLYVLKGGVAAVGWTNTFQGIIMLVIAWTFGLWLPFELYGGVGAMFERIATERPDMLTLPGLATAWIGEDGGTPWTWGAYSSSILVSVIGVTMWPHLFMKAFTAKDEKTLRRTVVLFPTFQLFLIPIFLIGFAGILVTGLSLDNPDYILPELILNTGLPPIIVGLFCAGALSASMSTGDALLHAAASITVEDGINPLRGGKPTEGHLAGYADRRADGPEDEVGGSAGTRDRRPLTDDQQRRLMRWLVVILGVVAYAFALDPESSLVILLLSAYGLIAQLAPPVWAALYWKRATTKGVLAGFVAGAATTLHFFYWSNQKPFGIHEGILGLLVHVPVLIIVSLLTQPQGREQIARFFPEKSEGPA